MMRKWLMFGIPVLAMLVIVACFAVTLTPVAAENETITPTPPPSPTPPPVNIISKGPFAPNTTVRIEVRAPDVENVTAEIDGSNFSLQKKDNETWIGEIKVPDKIGMYNLTILADGEEIWGESLEVLPVWHVFLKKCWWYLLVATVFIIIAFVSYFLYHRGNMDQRREKLKVMVRNEKGKGLGGAKVTVKGLTNSTKIPMPKKTNEIGMTDFELPVGEYEITVEKEGYKPRTFTREITRGENKEEVQLTPAEHVLKVEVKDKEGAKIKGARVGILKGKKDLGEGKTDEWGICKLKMPEAKGEVYVFAEKEGYEEAKNRISMEQPPISLSIELKRKLAELKLKVLDENGEPLSDAEVMIDNKSYYTDVSGEVKGIKVPVGKHKLHILKRGYEPYEGAVDVGEGGILREIKLKAKYGALKVKVVDGETEEPVDGIKVVVKGAEEITDKEGLVSFDKIPVGLQTIEVSDPTDVYSPETQKTEIKDKKTTDETIKLSSSFEIPATKKEKLDEASKYLKDQRKRVAAYDCYIPDYYMKIGEKLVGIVSDTGKSRKLLRLVRCIHDKPPEFVVDLADVISDACREIGKGMRERRNLEIFEDIKRFVVDKGLAEANIEVSLGDVEEKNIEEYIKGGEEGVKMLLREIDQALTKTPGSINPMAVLFRIAREIMNSDTGSDAKARALVASLILEYVRVMLNDNNIKERLRHV